MGWLAAVGQQMREVLSLPRPLILDEMPAQTFDSSPRPLAQLFAEMHASGPAARVGRAEALSVAAVQRGRNALCSIATLPLRLYRGLDIERSPLLEQLDPDVPNVVTLAQTIEDLAFEGLSWWLITAQDFDGYPVAVRHLDVGLVTLDAPAGANNPFPSGVDGRGVKIVWVDGKPVTADKLIRFDSPNPGLLKANARAIRRALLLDRLASTYADNPRPLDYFTDADDPDVEPMGDDEIGPFLAEWQTKRKMRSTAWIPGNVKRVDVNAPSPAEIQLVELQRQVTLEIANGLGVDPEDLGVSTTSRTYFNAQDRRTSKINETYAPYMAAITQRLSMGDVTRRGYVVKFDLADYLKPDPVGLVAYWKGLKDMGVMDADEIRAAAGLSGRAPKPEPAPAPPPPAEPAPEQVDASRQPDVTFDGPSTLTFDTEVVEFSVDASARTIEGLALPYGKVGRKGGMAYRFERGALQWADPGRVKLLVRHDTTQAIGRAVELTDTPAGLRVKFKVARGAAGDEALSLAEDGVLDGLSPGVDFDMSADTSPDPRNRGAVLVRRADLREVSLTPMPVFDDSRVSKVAASRDEGDPGMPEQETEAQPQTTPPATGGITLTAEQFDQLMRRQPAEQPEPEARPVVNPTRLAASVTEPVPYRFDRGGNFVPSEADFSTDLRDMAFANDQYGTETEAGKRVMALLRETFAVTPSGNVTDLNPTIQRPDMYVDQRDYRTPLWDMVNKGAPPNGVNPFRFPKFSAASGLVGDHTEGTEPTSGSYTATGQTVNPTALSGKASITREVWDMGGNPAVSTLIFNQMKRGYREGLESATATFLNTLTAAADINLNTGASAGAAPTAAQLSTNWESALADLQFIRGYDFDAFAIEANLYKAFVAARDGQGRPLYPIIGATNANGTAASRFRTLDLGGVVGVPSWALTATAGSVNNSWLFDSSTVHGWATAPQRLEFPGTSSAGAYAPVAMVDLAIWGYKAFANSDIAGVRQVTYDTTT